MRTLLLVLAVLTAAPGSAQTVRLSESFDGVAPPALPAGWSGDFATSTSSASSGSGGANLADTGTGTATAESAAFSLEGATGGTVSYLARRTSSYPAEAITVVFVTAAGETSATGNGLPTASSTWAQLSIQIPAGVLGEADVRIQFRSSGGTSSGSNARIDDVSVVTTGGEPPVVSTFGFADSELDVLAGSSGGLVPLQLDWAGGESLHGLQFRLTASSNDVTVTGFQRGPALLDLAAWTLGYEVDQTIVLSNNQSGLVVGSYAPLLSAVVDAPNLADSTQVTLSLTSVIGATAVPEGTDAELALGQHTLALRILPRVGLFEVADTLSVGEAATGTSSNTTLWLFNRGTADLTLVNITTDHPAFTVAPASATIPPADSVLATVTFAPTSGDIGYQSARLVVDGTPHTHLIATGRAVWGDATNDGAVDVGDIVLGVDVALGRVSPTSDMSASLDLYPFPEGDGAIDIRDLTVLTQAVLRGEWPNALPLSSHGGPAGKRFAQFARFTWTDDLLSVQLDRPVRALQGRFQVARETVRAGSALVAERDGIARVVWVNMDAQDLPAGDHVLARTEVTAFVDGVVIDGTGERYQVTSGPPPETRAALPYPNPFDPSRGALRLPGVHQITVFDLLGRRVWLGVPPWDGRSSTGELVAPGLYGIRVAGRSHTILIRE